MESNINLESLRDLSDSQLEALLRFDSPPETPVQLFKEHSIKEDLNTCKSDSEALSFNCDEFASQIDFSIFTHCSSQQQWQFSPLNIQTHANDDSIIETYADPTTPMQKNEENKYEGDFFVELNKSENTSITKMYDVFAKKVPRMTKFDDSYLQRKCQTQLKRKSDFKNTQQKIISSCPPQAKNDLLISSTNSTELCKNNATCLSFDKSFYDEIADMDIFQKTQTANNEEQSQAKIARESRHQLEENKTQLNAAPKFSESINLLMDGSSIPFSVRQLYDIVKTNYSNFAFIYALSSQLCQDRVPMDCFVTLKMSLLLSLVSIGNNENRPPIPIVALTNDTYMTDYLMTNIGQLGSRFLGPVDESKSFFNRNWIGADPIILAQGGVYYAGDWTRLKLRRAETIFKSIECSSVVVEKSTLNVTLETAIWTHWRSFKFGTKDQQMFNKFLKIFGIPIFVSDDNHEALIDYTLEQCSIRVFESTVDHLSINEDDMRTFLVYVSQNNVDLSPEAALLLKNYFVASRSMRQDCLSQQSYTMLKQFAESFAKLSMHKVVLYDHALAAIIMCEHFIENIFSFSDNAPPHFGNFTFIGAVDKYLKEFKEWLDSFIEKFKN